MPLLALWWPNPQAVDELTIEQVVSAAGDGALKDGSLCSRELRQFFGQIRSERIASYIDHCLSSSFGKGGMVLQDLVNELGRRLDFEVADGRYQGISSAIGFDGLWKSPEKHSIVAEVKTTDAYRISLDAIAGYRDRLLSSGEVSGSFSILIVVGRQDTGELEAQIRGSRHAWDIRLISADALIRLVQLKENTADQETARKIRSLLSPMEYTRLDRMVDVMFTAAKDVESVASEDGQQDGSEDEIARAEDPLKRTGTWEFTDSRLLQAKREEIVSAMGNRLGNTFIRKSRALSWSADHHDRIACTISKRYVRKGSHPYWYAYHPEWDDFLKEGRRAFLVLGCMDIPVAFAIPWGKLHPILDSLNTTTKDERTYWHVQLREVASKYSLLLPKKLSFLPLDEFVVTLPPRAAGE